MRPAGEHLYPIGKVADVLGLSLRTIRYYDEIGLVTPSARSSGGYRLYNAQDIDRLLLIKRMKPLGYPLEAMADLLSMVDALGTCPDAERAQALEQLLAFADNVSARIQELEVQLAYAREFHERVREEIVRLSPREGGTAGQGRSVPS